jgi:iron complex outermembrane receptor protein
VPVAVTAFTETSLDNLDVQDMGDLDAQVPNLTVYAARGSSSTVTAYIRGVGQSDPLWGVDPGVGIYLDDVYIARPQGALLDVFDVERIEVLRGPQGTLYGKNTIGGAIKYVSKPLTRIRYGDVGHGRQLRQLDVKASLNLPLGSDWVVGRVSLASLNRDGFGENLAPASRCRTRKSSPAAPPSGYVGSGQVIARGRLDRRSIRRARRADARTQCVQPADPTPYRRRWTTATTCATACPTSTTRAMDGASATINWNLADNWWFKSITAYRESDTDTNDRFRHCCRTRSPT